MRPRAYATGAVIATAVVALAATLFLSVTSQTSEKTGAEPSVAVPPPTDVVFVLDTTSSMSSLIEGAKQKIWSIASSLSAQEAGSQLRVGLVGFRDIHDAYVTKVIPLTSDMDALYQELAKFNAQGGGDGPEHVNKALFDALHSMQWRDGNVDRHIFLVGDAPPHDDYTDAPRSTELAARAKEDNISLHTIRCGHDVTTEVAWKRIAAIGGGSYASIAQDGGMKQVATAYDAELKELNDELADTAVGWGASLDSVERAKRSRRAAPAPVAADMASYASRHGKTMAGDLLDDLESGAVELAKIPETGLPPELRGRSSEEKKEWVRANRQRRREIKRQIRSLGARRAEAMAEESPASKSFDKTVVSAVKKGRE